MDEAQPLWAPSKEQVDNAPMTAFMNWCEGFSSRSFLDYDDFYQWSITDVATFWAAVWDYCNVLGSRGDRSVISTEDMLNAQFFPDALLSFAQNLLNTSGTHDALIFRSEDKISYNWSWDRLREEVSRMQQAMRGNGITQGDRIAAMLPNMPETIALMLAASSIGAIWSSCSPDFGVQGVIDRFGQIEPKLFICCDSYWYNGKKQVISEKVVEISKRLDVEVLIVPLAGADVSVFDLVLRSILLSDYLAPYQSRELDFVQLPFSHPLYILFSSGTTGIPKCIVHSAGGTLLQHLKEHRFHNGLVRGDRLFYFTTCSWMMWNWLVTGLASGVTLCLYDGSPFAPDGNVLFDYAEQEKFTVFGTSAKYIDALRKAGIRPIDTHNLTSLRSITSTGSPLSPEGYAFVYEALKADIHLASISGGTDIMSCFVLGNPIKPVWKGEIQGAGLGMAVDVWNDGGRCKKGEKGELVCTVPFPSQPVSFWNDPAKQKYHAAYFDRYDNVWCHGDFAEWTEHDGIIIHGRSDATLNPGGVRIGTAEIYNVVEQLDEVNEAICIGQEWDDDIRIVLFVRLAEKAHLDIALQEKIRSAIRVGATPRHVPAVIVSVADIPHTKSGKIVELAVKEIVHGRDVKNREALANPEALALYQNLAPLQ